MGGIAGFSAALAVFVAVLMGFGRASVLLFPPCVSGGPLGSSSASDSDSVRTLYLSLRFNDLTAFYRSTLTKLVENFFGV